MDIFDIHEFRNPNNRYYPVYVWEWNESVDKAGIRKQIDDMSGKNIRNVYVLPMSPEFRPNTMVANLRPEYLSDEYFRMLSYAVDYADTKGIKFWIYDEAGWPSGNANFLVTQDCDSLKMKIAGEDGKEIVLDRFADLTNPNATQKFMDLTHRRHKEKMGASFEKLAPYVFTDEPNICAAPCTDGIKAEYKKRTGKELDITKIVKHDDPEFNIIYHDICARLFSDNYFALIQKWCNENGMMSTGHLNCENETLGYRYGGDPYPMRLLRLMDVPGIDTIWGQIDPGKECLFFPRLASSAAEQIGKGLSLSESMSIYGSISYERSRYIYGYQLVRGINILNPMVYMYDDTGYYSIRQRPSYSIPQPGEEYLKDFNTYLASLQYVMQHGKPDNDCALYMPMRSFWADDEDTQKAVDRYEAMGAEIERHHGQFDIVDDDLISECDTSALKRGEIKLGRACYKKLYIPADKYMPQDVRARLEIFKAGGGRIYGAENAEYDPVMEITGDHGYLRVHKRKYDNCEVYLVFNEAAERVCAKINMPEGSFELNAFDGQKYALCDEYTLESGEIRLFMTNGCNAPFRIPTACGKKIAEITEFEFKAVRQFTLDCESAKYRPVAGETVITGCGDWKTAVGDDFSGECEYRTHFKAETDKDLVLSLGMVYHNCEAFINGYRLGAVIVSPYRFVIDKALLKNENELILRVSNTTANAFVHFELPDEWEEKHIGPYHKIALELEKQFAAGGIIGPVELYEKK